MTLFDSIKVVNSVLLNVFLQYILDLGKNLKASLIAKNSKNLKYYLNYNAGF